MEDILASIRRIISDDEAPQANAANEVEEGAPVTETSDEPMSQDDLDKLFDSDDSTSEAVVGEDAFEDDVLELTDELAVEDDLSNDALELVEGLANDSNDVAFVEDDETDGFEQADSGEKDFDLDAMADKLTQKATSDLSGKMDHLLSQNTDDVVHSAFENLSHTILANNARTLEDLVEEMLRPMLKTWLDHNLPTLVERLVRQEIERVSRGR